jgi:2-iminoacetate synthase
MIVTARERADIRRRMLKTGCTQTDASTKIGIGAYSEAADKQDPLRQQFMIQDTRSLDEVIREIAGLGFITSFCTAGYRCGRTGKLFMKISRSGKLRNLCIPNAMITFKEFLLDYASEETRRIGEKLIEEHMQDVPENIRAKLIKKLEETENGARDLSF